MEWPEQTVSRLRILWTEGHSTAEIGRRLGLSKNAVVGKAHRLDLEARPSPIKGRVTRGLAPPSIPRPKVTLPPLPSDAPPAKCDRKAQLWQDRIANQIAAIWKEPAPASVQPLVVPPPPPAQAPIAFTPRTAPCCWPMGHPKDNSFRFCDGPALRGRPYCGEHSKIAYIRVRDRREDAA